VSTPFLAPLATHVTLLRMVKILLLLLLLQVYDRWEREGDKGVAENLANNSHTQSICLMRVESSSDLDLVSHSSSSSRLKARAHRHAT